jgi:hypothetical protein
MRLVMATAAGDFDFDVLKPLSQYRQCQADEKASFIEATITSV